MGLTSLGTNQEMIRQQTGQGEEQWAGVKSNSFPAVGDLVDTGADVGAGFVSGPTFAQQLVVVCFAMADVREHCHGQK